MTPDLRLTVRPDGVVRALAWMPHLVTSGPLATLFDARGRAGVTIADVTILRPDRPSATDAPDGDDDILGLGPDRDPPDACGEIIVEVLCGGAPPALEAIRTWAARVGHRRLWLPEGVVDVEPLPRGRMESRCGSCRGRLVDGLPKFWDWVDRRGYFPTGCPLCGADLEQWRPVRTRADRPTLALVRERDDDGLSPPRTRASG